MAPIIAGGVRVGLAGTASGVARVAVFGAWLFSRLSSFYLLSGLDIMGVSARRNR